MNEYTKYNAQAVLAQVNKDIEELTNLTYQQYLPTRHALGRYSYRKHQQSYSFKIRSVYDELSIFDWWNDKLSISQLKQMKAFLEQAIKLGFTGYVCFKVGAEGCSHGMWAHKNETTDGFSPDGDCLFHSFRFGDCYWSTCIDGAWDMDLNLAQVKRIVAGKKTA